MRRFAFASLALLFAAPGHAELVTQTDTGFVVRHVAEVTALPDDAWQALLAPAEWWSGDHSFSGDAKNLTIDARPGGCFCEALPGEGDKGWLNPRGGVEHMRVVLADRPKALRMIGALGPLQSEALQGTLTVSLKPIEGGTRLTWEYVVGGYMRYKREQIAPAVDKLIGEQLTRLAERLGPKVGVEGPRPAPGMEAGR